MATFTASAAQSTAQAIYHVNRDVTRVIKYSKTTSFSAGDVVQMCKVPAGAIVNNVVLACSFSAGVATVNVGDGNDTSAYGASVVLSGSAVSATAVPYRGFGRSYSVEDTIDIVVAAISTPPAPAQLTLVISYTCTDHSGE